MEIEQQRELTQESEDTNKMSVPYLVFTFGFGLSLIVCLVYAGLQGVPFILTIAVGGVAQVLFRVTKRAWRNALNPAKNTSKHSSHLAAGIIETIPTIKVFAMLYVTMVAVSALWYGIGSFFGWLF